VVALVSAGALAVCELSDNFTPSDDRATATKASQLAAAMPNKKMDIRDSVIRVVQVRCDQTVVGLPPTSRITLGLAPPQPAIASAKPLGHERNGTAAPQPALGRPPEGPGPNPGAVQQAPILGGGLQSREAARGL
jgi:hypothetical protein